MDDTSTTVETAAPDAAPAAPAPDAAIDAVIADAAARAAPIDWRARFLEARVAVEHIAARSPVYLDQVVVLRTLLNDLEA